MMKLVQPTTTTQEERVDWERNAAVRDALQLIKTNFSDLAFSRLYDSVHKQARWMPSDLYTARGVTTYPHPKAALRSVS